MNKDGFLVDPDELKASSIFLDDSKSDNLHVSPSSRLNILFTSVLVTSPHIIRILYDIVYILRDEYKTPWAIEHSQRILLSAQEMDNIRLTCQYVSDCISDFDCSVTKDIQTSPSLSTASMEDIIKEIQARKAI